MQRGAALSAAFHVIIVLLAYFGLPSLFTSEVPIEQPIPVEVYTVRDETVLPPPEIETEPDPEPVEEAAPIPPEPDVAEVFTPPPSDPVPASPAPPEPEPEVVKAPDPAPAPPPPLVVPEVSEIPPPPPKPAHVAKAEPAPEIKPEVKPEPQPDLFDSLLASLAEAAPEAPELEAAIPEANASETPETTTVIQTLSDQPLSLNVLEAIRRQIEDIWNVPAGAADAGDLEVKIEIVLMQDGRVLRARIVDRARLYRTGEAFFRSMAESALRAVLRASPLRGLPPEKYEQWREISFTFRPPV